MSINLALILTLLTLISGVVILLDKFVWKTADGDSVIKPDSRTTLIEYSRSFFPVLLFVLVVRSFVFEPFRIPSGSMTPTLLTGDFVFVKKYSYGLRLPVTETKFIETGSPERGDVVVFRNPHKPKINFIKRVVGLPGDKIEFERQRLTINGVRMPLEETDRIYESAMIYREDLEGRQHDIRIENPKGTNLVHVYTVPEGHYFMMGDNRDNSNDSRRIGVIPEEYLVGEATRVWMHWVPGWNAPDWGRIGTKIE